MRLAFIYALCDPQDGEIRYIGQTVDPGHRFYQHCNPDDTPRGQWVADLRDRDMLPELRILDTVPKGEADRREKDLICEHSKECDLFNINHVPIENMRPGLTIEEMSRAYVKHVEEPGDVVRAIKIALYSLKMTHADAAEAIGMSVHSVNMALSTGERKPTLERLERMLKDRLRRIS